MNFLSRDPATIHPTPRDGTVGRFPLGRIRREFGLPPLLDNLFREEASGHDNDNEFLLDLLAERYRTQGKLPPLAGSRPAGPSASLRDEASPHSAETSPLELSRREAPSTDLILQNLWASILPALRERVSEKNFTEWLSPVEFVTSDEGLIALEVPNSFYQEYLEEHYQDVIEEELARQYSQPFQVIFQVALKKEEPKAPQQELAAPQTPEGRAALELAEKKARIEAQEAELVAIERRHRGFDAQREAIRLAKLRHAVEEEERQTKHRARFTAATLPLLRQPGNPQRQRQDHTRVSDRKDASALEPNTDPNDGPFLPYKVTKPPKPDSS